MTLVKFKNGNGNGFGKHFPATITDLFNDLFNEEVMPRNFFKSVPAVNISERANDFVIELAAPGMKKEDIKVEVDNDVLSISSEKKEEMKDENSRYTRKEFSYTSFKRTFTLPEFVEADKINAEYKDGMLTLTLPKKEEAKVKAVKEIKVS